jgi:hypothetical protein
VSVDHGRRTPAEEGPVGLPEIHELEAEAPCRLRAGDRLSVAGLLRLYFGQILDAHDRRPIDPEDLEERTARARREHENTREHNEHNEQHRDAE